MVLFTVNKQDNLYKIKFNELSSQKFVFFKSINKDSWIWHKNMLLKLISKLQKYSFMKVLSFECNVICETYIKKNEDIVIREPQLQLDLLENVS